MGTREDIELLNDVLETDAQLSSSGKYQALINIISIAEKALDTERMEDDPMVRKEGLLFREIKAVQSYLGVEESRTTPSDIEEDHTMF